MGSSFASSGANTENSGCVKRVGQEIEKILSLRGNEIINITLYVRTEPDILLWVL